MENANNIANSCMRKANTTVVIAKTDVAAAPGYLEMLLFQPPNPFDTSGLFNQSSTPPDK
jgi:hypothetical protein